LTELPQVCSNRDLEGLNHKLNEESIITYYILTSSIL